MQFPDEFNIADYFLFDRIGEGLGDKVAAGPANNVDAK